MRYSKTNLFFSSCFAVTFWFLSISFALNAEGSLQGIVTDISKNPLSNILIEIKKGPQVIESTLTDEQGLYTFSSIPEDTYSLTAVHYQYRSGVYKHVVINSNVSKTVNFSLARNGNIKGKIQDTVSCPIEGATVYVMLKNSIVATGISQLDGSYTIDNVNPAAYTITVRAEDYQQSPLMKGSVKSDKSTTLNFNLKLYPGSITGIIIDDLSGSPIGGADVVLLVENVLFTSTKTAQDGTFLISGLEPRNYYVRASATGLQTSIIESTVYSKNNTSANFSLILLPGSVIGQICDSSSGDTLEGIYVEAIQDNKVISSCYTNWNGDYSLSGLAPDHYSIRFSDVNYQTSILETLILSNEKNVLNTVLQSNPGTLTSNCEDKFIPEPQPQESTKVKQETKNFSCITKLQTCPKPLSKRAALKKLRQKTCSLNSKRSSFLNRSNFQQGYIEKLLSKRL